MGIKPDWFKVRPPSGGEYLKIKSLKEGFGLSTVCEEARCPNIAECWGAGTATFMLMGDVCTRHCRFCAVKSGHPMKIPDPLEPTKLAQVISRMKLSYVVITSVDRDDLDDGGASHFATTIREVKKACPETLVEVLIPDFSGKQESLKKVVEAKPDVVAHNIETTRRLTPTVRDPRANFDQSIQVLRTIKQLSRGVYTKSSIMLGLGETHSEVTDAMKELRAVDVDFLTIGQYLQPTKGHLAVKEYITPETFEAYKTEALALGFRYVASGPLVRSSYKAGEFFIRSILAGSKESYATGR